MNAVTGAVVIAGLTTVGKPTAEAVGRILERILSPSADALGEGLAAPLRAWARRRGELASARLLDAADMLLAAGREPQPVPGRLLMPLLQGASLEEDQTLQRKWTALLANSALNQEIPPAFPRILAELSPLDVKILQYAYDQVIATGRHPTHVNWKDAILAAGFVFPPDYPTSGTGVLAVDDPVLAATAQNLIRLDLVTGSLNQHYLLNHEAIAKEMLNLTPFGFMFVRACNPPQ